MTTRGGKGGFLGTIRGRITQHMLLVAAIPVLAVGALTIGSLLALTGRTDDRLEANRSELTHETIAANHAEQARLVLARLSSFVDERLDDVIDWSRSDTLVDAAGTAYPELTEISDWPSSLVDSRYEPGYRLDQSGRSDRWLAQQLDGRGTFVDVVLTNANGLTVGRSQSEPNFTNADQEWWLRAWADGAYIGPVETSDITGISSFDLAVRVTDPISSRSVGVVRASVNIAGLQPLTDEFDDESTGRDVRVLTVDGILLAETATDHDPNRIATQAAFGADHGEAYSSALSGSEPSGNVILEDLVGGFSRTSEQRVVSRLGAEIANPGWVAFVEQPASAALEPLGGLESLRSDLGDTARLLTIVIAMVIIATLALAFVLARMLADRIAQPLNQLRIEANRLADRELPDLIDSLHSPDMTGEIPLVTPIDIEADGEVAELATAFNSVRSTAVELAAAQAIGRTRDVSNILLNLGRRNQHLVGRQLRFIDELERTESDADVLRNLFILDQMATRMRRNAESLLVLAGEDSPRRVSRPRPISEVIRAATGEVEDYGRVQLAEIEDAFVQPMVVNDLTHLVAELIENATNFSPPQELVEVIGTPGNDGSYTLSIVDHGIGIPIDQLREVNHRLQDGVFTSDTTSSFLGLHVVGRLAIRHGIDVRLAASDPTGITAEVALPPTCIAEAPSTSQGEGASEQGGKKSHSAASHGSKSWLPPTIKAASRRSSPLPAAATATEVSATAEEDEDAPELIATARRGVRNRDETNDPTSGLRAVVADAVDIDKKSDDTQGLPIPPFRARESKRPVGVAGGPTDHHDPSGPPRERATPATDLFQVRRRIKRHTAGETTVVEPVTTDVGDRDVGTVTRAAEVRDKLNRFADGVEAAKTATAAPDAVGSNGIADQNGGVDQPGGANQHGSADRRGGGDMNSTDHSTTDSPNNKDKRGDGTGGILAFRRLVRRSKRSPKRR